MALPSLLTVDDYQRAAQASLSQVAHEYLECGVADELTLQRNRDAYNEVLLRPRVLVDVSQIDTSLTLFGRKLPFPILLAPTGYHKLFHAEGELETVRGAASAGTVLIGASFSTVSFEEMAAASPEPLWFQLYFQPDRSHTQRVLNTVLAAGCQAICLTVDVPVNGPRDREARAHFALPAGAIRANFAFLGDDVAGAAHRPADKNIYSAVRSSIATWKDLEWLRSVTPVPLLMKGVVHPQDARRAVECGCDGLIVSNHGARSVDTVPSTIEILPQIKQAVGPGTPVLLDGGIRRGTDIFKALALGASAVLVGRPFMYGLAVEGASGVAKVLAILRMELEMTMGLMGCPGLAQINRDCLWPRSAQPAATEW